MAIPCLNGTAESHKEKKQVQRQKLMPWPTEALGSAIVFFLVALYVVKANFMFFFRRLGSRGMPRFNIIWWISFAVVMACGVVSLCLGVPTFRCLFNGIVYTLEHCETASDQTIYFTYFRVTVAL